MAFFSRIHARRKKVPSFWNTTFARRSRNPGHLATFTRWSILDSCLKTATGNLEGLTIQETPEATCAIVLAAAGYLKSPRKGDAIEVNDAISANSSWLIHAGTKTEDSTLKTVAEAESQRWLAKVKHQNTPV